MVGLRKACSFLLVAWVVLSPLMLAWHHALAHGSHAAAVCSAESQLCCDSAKSEAQLDPCPFNNVDVYTSTISEAACPSGCNEDCSETEHSCPVCEMLLHDDVLTVQWVAIPFSVQVVQSIAVSEPISLALDIPNYWSVRGPPCVA